MNTHFKVGDKREIFQQPISQRHSEGVAELVECVQSHEEFNYGNAIIERWMVRFGEGEETQDRYVSKRRK